MRSQEHIWSAKENNTLTDSKSHLLSALYLCTIGFTCFLLVAYINFASLFVLMIGVFLAVLFDVYFSFEQLTCLPLFLTYVTIAALIYLANKASFGDVFGFAGFGGINSDDSYYYLYAVPEVPYNYPRMLKYPTWQVHPFSKLLSIFATPIYQSVGQIHFLDLLIVTAFIFIFTPILASKIVHHLSDDARVAKLTFWLCATCPFMVSQCLILFIEPWAITCILVIVYAFLKHRYFVLGAGLVLLYFIKIEAYSAVASILLALEIGIIRTSHPIFRFIRVAVILALIAGGISQLSDTLQPYLLAKGISINAFYRVEFAETLSAQQVKGEHNVSLYTIISAQPLPIRLPLSSLFYFGAPYLTINNLSAKGAVSPVYVIQNIFAIAFVLFYLYHFASGIDSIIRKRSVPMLCILIPFIFMVLILSQVSLQVRHKIWVWPLFYMVVAYGYYNPGRPEVAFIVRTGAGLLAVAELGIVILELT